MLKAADAGLPLPVALSLGYVAHAQINIPWSLSGPLELDIDGVSLLVRAAWQ